MKEQAGSAGMAVQRREQMLHAALEVIVERGYPETRITDVAERAGASPALVIYYFKTRDHLLTEALRYSEDGWYGAATRRIEAIKTSAGQLEEFIAMMCLPEQEGGAEDSPHNPAVAAIRQKIDERWRETIRTLVLTGQEAGEFAAVDADDFAVALSALLYGFVVPIALDDPAVGPAHAFELSMQFASGRLGFSWNGRRASN
jgi:AcrR family transcriptional regulator